MSAERGYFIRTLRAPPRLSPLISAIKHWCAQNRGRTWTDPSIPPCCILFHLSVKVDSFNTSHLLNSQINEERRQLSESVRLMKGARLNHVSVFTTQVDLGRFHCCIWCNELFTMAFSCCHGDSCGLIKFTWMNCWKRSRPPHVDALQRQDSEWSLKLKRRWKIF